MVDSQKKKSVRRKVGDILKINLRDGFHGYAHVSTDPCIIFYDGRFKTEISVNEIIKLKVLFILSVSNYAIKDGIWPVIGRSGLNDEQLKKPYMFKQDPISGQLSIYHSDFAETNYERAATVEECEDLERMAIWDHNHVEDRLNDHYENKPNVWVSQLALKR